MNMVFAREYGAFVFVCRLRLFITFWRVLLLVDGRMNQQQQQQKQRGKKIIQGKLFTTFLSFIDDSNGTVLTSFLFKWCPYRAVRYKMWACD